MKTLKSPKSANGLMAYVNWVSVYGPEAPMCEVLGILWKAHEKWAGFGQVVDSLLAELQDKSDDRPFLSSDILGVLKLGAASGDLSLEMTGQTYAENDGQAAELMAIANGMVLTDQLRASFECDLVPLRLFASATDRFGDQTCQIQVVCDEMAEEVLSLDAIGKNWACRHLDISLEEFTDSAGQLLAEAKNFFEAHKLPATHHSPTF